MLTCGELDWAGTNNLIDPANVVVGIVSEWNPTVPVQYVRINQETNHGTRAHKQGENPCTPQAIRLAFTGGGMGQKRDISIAQ